MWFVFLGIGFAVLIVGGLYLRRRVLGALANLGVARRWHIPLRWLMLWFLFGYPLLMVAVVALTLWRGAPTMPRFDSAGSTWLLVYPFFLSLLVLVQSLPYLLIIDFTHWSVCRFGSHRSPRAAIDRVRAIAVVVVTAGFALYTPIRIIVERDVLRVRMHQVGQLDASGSPFRIAFVADLQQDADTGVARTRQVVAEINAAKADVVLSGGDWINAGPDYIQAAADSAGAMRSRLGTYSVRGDHEHFGYIDRDRSVAEIEVALAERGVALLNNEIRWLQHRGKRIAVLFLNYNYIYHTDPAKISALVAQLASADYSIVVSHQFDSLVAALVKDKVDLVLAGHTHGGQVNPVIGVVHVPLARIETQYVDGRYQLGTTTVIVTAGIGFSVAPFRYASPASLEVIDLHL